MSAKLFGAATWTFCELLLLPPPMCRLMTAATFAALSPDLAISAIAAYLAASAMAFA